MDVYLAFFSTFLNILDRTRLCASLFLLGGTSQLIMARYNKELITGSRNSVTQNAKLLLKMPISNLREIWSKMALFEFGPAKSDVR